MYGTDDPAEAEAFATVAARQTDPLNTARGVLGGVTLGLLLWAVVIGAAMLALAQPNPTPRTWIERTTTERGR